MNERTNNPTIAVLHLWSNTPPQHMERQEQEQEKQEQDQQEEEEEQQHQLKSMYTGSKLNRDMQVLQFAKICYLTVVSLCRLFL